MRVPRWWLAVAAMVWATAAGAETRGLGSREPAWTPPDTKSAGPPVEAKDLRSRGADFERGLGMLGAAGAARDRLGPWRLGRYGGRPWAASYGEAAQPGSGDGSSYQAWRSGDLVRSASSADVRAARGEQAPDLEWVGAAGRSNETYGQKFQRAQERPQR